MTYYKKMAYTSFILLALFLAFLFIGLVSGYVIIIPTDANVNDYYNFTMTDNVKNELKQHWNDSGNREYIACINGEYDSIFLNDDVNNGTKNFHINKIMSYKISEYKTEASLRCTTNVKLHNHPNGACRASGYDIEVFKLQHEEYGTLFMMIQCAENKFVVYSWEAYGRAMIYET